MFRIALALVLSFGMVAGATAQDSASVLARAKVVSGGPRWDAARSWRGEGALSAGGLSGDIAMTVDLATGRSASSYSLGPIQGAEGFDGRLGWERDPGGEVAALDAAAAVRRARSQAWLDARAYWFPLRGAATLGKAQVRELDGKRYAVIVATPHEAEPVTLWFAIDSGLLARVQFRQGRDTVTIAFDDYRDVQGLRMPFHWITDWTDAAGRTDPRRRNDVRLHRIALNVAVSDADFAMPRMKATARIADKSGVARVPFELINNHIYASGSVDGKPARFIVDTGGANLLTPAAAAKFGIKGQGKLAAAGVGSKRVDLALAHARSVALGKVELDEPVFYILDLGQLAAVEGTAIDGLVGYEMFRRFGVSIDYAGRMLTISRPDKFAPPRGASVVAFRLDDRTPVVSATLDGMPIRLSVDTGSRSSLTVHSPFVRKHHLLARYHAAASSVTGWGVGGPRPGHPVRLGTLQLGDLRIHGIAADLFTGNTGSFADPDLGGNLGGGVLRRFTVTFDYANRKMYLVPNASFATPDAFDRSGLWLLDDGDALRVADVAADSAAARAGLRVDDRIVTIDGRKVMQKTLAQWRGLLSDSPAGTRIAVGYLRDGTKSDTEMTLADRIPDAAK